MLSHSGYFNFSLPSPPLELGIRRAEIASLDSGTASGRKALFLHRCFVTGCPSGSWALSTTRAAGLIGRTQEAGAVRSSSVLLEWQILSLGRSHTSPTPTARLLPPTSGLGMVPSLH